MRFTFTQRSTVAAVRAPSLAVPAGAGEPRDEVEMGVVVVGVERAREGDVLLIGRCGAVGPRSQSRAVMNGYERLAVAALGLLLLFSAATAAAGVKRPRPNDVPGAQTAMAPNDFQVYNDYATPERTFFSRRAVVHFVVLGIDAPPLNDDDLDGVPDYVERVGDAADRALAYYERRGFRLPRSDEGGPDARPDIYVSRFSPGTLGVAFPADRAEGGAFAVVANNLDPSAERSFASVYATVAHELFHLVQFSYFAADSDPVIPTWILEGTAAGMETRVNPELEDLVSTIQLRRWFSATDRTMTTQSYGAQLLWRQLDSQAPRFLPALLTRLAARPRAGEGQRVVASTYASVTGKPFAAAFHRFAVSVATDYADDLEPRAVPRRGVLAPLSVRYARVPLTGRGYTTLNVTFPRRARGAAATLVYRRENAIPGEPPRTRLIAPHVIDGGRTLAFTLTAGRRSSALLVLSNGGAQAAAYAVSAR